jgi:hydroxymethylpyrimidine pyrophosphatase-like HAD family hydrolase
LSRLHRSGARRPLKTSDLPRGFAMAPRKDRGDGVVSAGGELATKGRAALAVDMDGTLTTEGRPLGKDLIEALGAVRREGTKLILATGRCVKEAYELANEELFDGVVAENGAVLVVGGTKRDLAPAGWREVRSGLLPSFEPGCEEVIISAGREMLDVAERLISPASARIELNKDRLMIMPRGVDKGRGLAELLSSLGLTGGETTCIGDGENDLPMFEVAGVKVALGNSVEELKRRADIVTEGSDGEGTKEAIGMLFLRDEAGQRGRSVLGA